MSSAWQTVRAGGLTVAIVLAMSVSGGAATADPDPGAPSPSGPSAASPGASSHTGGGPTSGTGSNPTAGGSGNAQTSVRADQDALNGNMEDLKNLTADLTKAEQSIQDKLAAMKETREDQVSIADMFELQQKMIQLDQLSAMSSSIVSASNSALLSMARGVKE